MTRSQLFTPGRTELDYPVSLGVHRRYAEAQHDVDYLADRGFPVDSVEIVGTELRSVERVTGRLTRGKVAAAGALSGLWIGLFVRIAFGLFGDRNQLGFIVGTSLLGALFGLTWSQLGYRVATGRRGRGRATLRRPARWWRPSTRCSSSTSKPIARRSCSCRCPGRRRPDPRCYRRPRRHDWQLLVRPAHYRREFLS